MECIKEYNDKVEVNYENNMWELPKEVVVNTNEMILSSKKYKKNKFICVKILESGERICLYTNKEGLLILSNKINSYFNIKQRLFGKITRKNVYFWGIITYYENGKLDNLYLNDEAIGKVIRPFKVWKLKHIAFIKVPIKKIIESTEIHNEVKIGKEPDIFFSLRIKKRNKDEMYYHCMKKINNDIILIRSTIKSNCIRITKIDFEPEYGKINRIKNTLARFLSKIIGKKEIVLLFEKETKRAEESGFYIFEKIINKNLRKTKAYFIIDKNSKDYKKIKEKYKNRIVEKYSFKHYLYIYLSKYFVSSELSNHVMNTRLYIKSLNDEINKKPLVFLQHGIMFAKPVDNPAAEGFYKDKTHLNIYKSVISSDLEATQFYKMGYNDDDLIKCGLTKFDTSFLNKDADKILFMQTYRYWEEGMINSSENIMKTTYYKSYMEVIKAFEKANLLDKLRVSCHPKFAECLVKAAPEYGKVIEKDLTKALTEAKIFITDYSSASYDAHYRGSYIIYYWADRDYLIENYKAIPPINESNADGVPVFSTDELIKAVEYAIKNNYKMDDKYEENYKKINEFHDGKNGDRLIDELIKLNILK